LCSSESCAVSGRSFLVEWKWVSLEDQLHFAIVLLHDFFDGTSCACTEWALKVRESEDGDRCVLRSASNSVSDVKLAWVDLVWCGCWSWCWCSCCRSVLLVFSNKGFVKSFALEVTLFLELLSKCDLLLDF